MKNSPRLFAPQSRDSACTLLLIALAAIPAFAGDGSADKKDDESTVVTVTARKQPENLQKLPLSATAVTKETIVNAGVRTVADAAVYAPGVVISEFSARKLSNPRFRGIGSSPNNPGVTTYIDGVPQLNSNSSSIELLDVNQIEFVRGPQGALFGRNTLGGLISISSTRPSLRQSVTDFTATAGNRSLFDFRGVFSEPITPGRSAYSVGVGYGQRDGYSTNALTGNKLDNRGAFFAKTQLLFKPAENKEFRLLLTGERDRDGDYGLNDVGAIRAAPFLVARDFEGFTTRDVIAPTLLFSSKGKKVDFSTTTGLVSWKTQDVTDLDYTPFPLMTRNNIENDTQLTHEFRWASAASAKPANGLKWQGGVSMFSQNYDSNAFNVLSPPIPGVPFPGFESHTQAALNDRGIGAFGQATLTRSKLDITGGLRADYESKKATLTGFTVPAFAAPTVQTLSDSYTSVSPQLGLAYNLSKNRMLYASAGQGFKAGGFNAASPAGTETYGNEKSRNYEIGLKTKTANGKITANLAAYRIDWKSLQLNVPFGVPGQFFIANVGNATSEGLELEVRARPQDGLELFAGGGLTDARFKAGSVSGGVAVGGNKLPFTPTYTANAGIQLTRKVSKGTSYLRAEGLMFGNVKYDDQNTGGQTAYPIVNLRAGVRNERAFVEGWVRNALNRVYVPIALPFPGLAPSGFIGEPGAPMTFGVSAGFQF